MKKSVKLLLAVFATSLLLGVSSCRDKTPGEKIEDGIEEVGDEIEDGTDEIGDEIEDAVDDN